MRPIERPDSLVATVAARVRQAIVDGDLKLGQAISERQLAEAFNVSKTPVREALAQLKVEGLIRIVPQTGAFVFTLGAREVKDLCEVRLVIESAALKGAVERDGRLFAQDLAAIVAKMVQARAQKDAKTYLRLDNQFHECFFAHCANALLGSAYTLFVGQIAALRRHLAANAGQMDLSFGEHQEMVKVVRAGEVRPALKVLEKHVARTRDFYATGVVDISVGNGVRTGAGKRTG